MNVLNKELSRNNRLWLFLAVFRFLLNPHPDPAFEAEYGSGPGSGSQIREHSALQNMKILNFFLFLWVIFAVLDMDLDPLT